MSRNDYIDSFEIKDIVNLDVLQSFQDKFSESLGFASIIVDKQGNQVTKPSNYTKFCKDLINGTELGNKRCAECHRKGGEMAELLDQPYIYICHAGLIDFATPISINGKLIGTILGGQVLTEKPDLEKYIAIAKEVGVDNEKLTNAVEEVEVVTKQRLKASAEVLFLVGNALSQIAYDQMLLKDVSEKLEKEIVQKDKLLEESKVCSEMKAQFFSTMSHELKTPLNIIFSSVQLLESLYRKDGEVPNKDTFLKYSNIMKQNCYRLLRLTNNIIDINKIESGYFDLSLKNEDIVKAIEDTVSSIGDYAKQKQIDVIFDTEVEEMIIAFDTEKLERVMLNLLSNAIKFSNPEGSIRVNVIDEGENIVISIGDDGIGIPDDMKDRIFDIFTQVNGSFTRNTEGSGIGLSIVKSIVELHGWRIDVSSKIDKGSEFRIILPIKTVTEEKNVNLIDKNIGTNNGLVDHVKIEFSDIYL